VASLWTILEGQYSLDVNQVKIVKNFTIKFQ